MKKRLSFLTAIVLALTTNITPLYATANCTYTPSTNESAPYSRKTVSGIHDIIVQKGIPVYGNMTTYREYYGVDYDQLDITKMDNSNKAVGELTKVYNNYDNPSGSTYGGYFSDYWKYTGKKIGNDSFDLEYSGKHYTQKYLGSNSTGGSNYELGGHMDLVDETYNVEVVDTEVSLTASDLTVTYGTNLYEALSVDNYSPILKIKADGIWVDATTWLPYYLYYDGENHLFSETKCGIDDQNSNKTTYEIEKIVNSKGQSVQLYTDYITEPGVYTVTIKAKGYNSTFEKTCNCKLTVVGNITRSSSNLSTTTTGYIPADISTTEMLQEIEFNSIPTVTVNDSITYDATWGNNKSLVFDNGAMVKVKNTIVNPPVTKSCSNYSTYQGTGILEFYRVYELVYTYTLNDKTIESDETLPLASSYVGTFSYKGKYKITPTASYDLYTKYATSSAKYTVTSCKNSDGISVEYNDNLKTKPGVYTLTIKAKHGAFTQSKTVTLTVKPTLKNVSYNNESKSVKYRTSKSTVINSLPTTANLILTDGTSITGAISNWESYDYNSNKSGTYTFTGKINLPSGVSNRNNINLITTLNVTVGKAPVVTFQTATSKSVIQVPYGTPLSEVLPKLSNTITVIKEDGTQATIDISGKSWTHNYQSNAPATYDFNKTFNTTSEFTNDRNLDLKIIQKVQVLNPTLVSIDYNPTDMSVDWGTTFDDLKKQIPDKATLHFSDGSTKIADIGNWTSTDYESTTGTYNLTGKIILPSGTYNYDNLDLTVTRTVSVADPSITNIQTNTSLSTIKVDYNTPILEVLDKIDNTVTLTCEDGITRTIHLTASDWKNNYNATTPAEYTFSANLTLPEDVCNTNNLSLTVIQKVEVLKPNLVRVELLEDSKETVDVTMLQPINIVRGLLNKTKVRLYGTNGYTEDVIVAIWDCLNYDKNTPATYDFTGTVSLPNTLTNLDNVSLNVVRQIRITKPSLSEINIINGYDGSNYDLSGSDSIVVPYGTSKEVALSQLNPKVLLTLNDGQKIEKNVDLSNLAFKNEYNSKVPAVYNATLDLTSYVPTFVDLTTSIIPKITYSIEVQKPKMTDFKIIDFNDGEELSRTTIGVLHVDYNTSKESTISRLPKQIKVTVNNGEVFKKDLIGNWDSSTFNPTLIGTHRFKFSGNFSEYLNEKDFELYYDVIVDKSIYVKAILDRDCLTLDPEFTEQEVIQMLPEQVTLCGSGGFEKDYPLIENFWNLSEVNTRVEGIYEAKYLYSIPEELDVVHTRDITLTCPITIGKPSIVNVDYSITTGSAISVSYGTSFNEAKSLLDKEITINLNDTLTTKAPIDSKGWKCDNYDPYTPGLYLAKAELELPKNILNKRGINLNVEQVVIVRERELTGIDYTGIPVLAFPYTTPISDIIDSLPKEVSFILDNGDILTTDVNSLTWSYCYNENSPTGNYDFSNEVMFVQRDACDYTNSTTASSVGIKLTTGSSLKVKFNQKVAIVNREVSSIEPLNGHIPNGETYKYNQRFEVIANLPTKFRVYFKSGGYVDVDCDDWVKVSEEQRELTYMLDVPLPEYTVGNNTLTATYKLKARPTDVTGKQDFETRDVENTGIIDEPMSLVVSDTELERQFNNIAFQVNNEDWYKNGVIQDIKQDVPPTIVDGRLYISVRYLAYALNIDEKDINWNPKTREIYLGIDMDMDKKADTEVVLTIGSNKVKLNNTVETIDGKPFIENGRTMLPISQISKLLLEGVTYSIKWIPETLEVKLVFDDSSDSDNTDYIIYEDCTM